MVHAKLARAVISETQQTETFALLVARTADLARQVLVLALNAIVGSVKINLAARAADGRQTQSTPILRLRFAHYALPITVRCVILRLVNRTIVLSVRVGTPSVLISASEKEK